MDVDEALETEAAFTALPNADEIAHVLAAEVRKLQEQRQAALALIEEANLRSDWAARMRAALGGPS